MLSIQTLLLAFAFCAISACVLTYFIRRYALAKDIIDCPNERSSHVIPTPRGGGMSIVLMSLLTLAIAGFVDSELWTMAIGCGLVACIGFIDDRKDLNPSLRLIGHFSGAWLVVYGSGLPPLTFFGATFDLGFVGTLLAVVGVVWLLNLYNFMDGINGLASVEAITVLVCMFALLWIYQGLDLAVTQVHFLVTASIIGFLFWNFPSARIFMGDAGSGFLGITLGALMIYTTQFGQEWLWAWLIVLGVFVVDATLTLLRRAIRGEKLSQAHCTHAYQWAARMHNSHTKVTLVVGAINLFWLAPISFLVVSDLADGFVMMVIAYIPLVHIALRYRAGEPVRDPNYVDHPNKK